MTQAPERIALFYTEGSSDKEYRVELRDAGNGQWMVLGFNGRRGSTLKEQKKTQAPVDYDTAKKEYDKVVKGKLKDGYTPDQSGAVYQSTDMADRFSGFVPQLLNSIREPHELSAVIHDLGLWAQEKHDGERRPVRASAGKIEGLNKEGVIVSLPMNVVDAVTGLGMGVLIDGEIIGERYVAFDLLEQAGQDLRKAPYAERLAALEALQPALEAHQVEVVLTARTPMEKRALFDALKAHGSEGAVFKKADAAYAPGRPASGGAQMKWKFTEDCSVRVAAQNPRKRSVSLECLGADGRTVVPLGNVTIPANAAVPAVGAIVTVNYLYLYDGGSLFQPTYKGERTDQSQPDTLDRFKLKQTVPYRAAAPKARRKGMAA